MTDQFERQINYLRVSITDRCNLNCFYCMPNGVPLLQHADILRYEEIVRLVRIAASLGITKVRITGGEPLVRKGCADLIRMLHDIPEIETIALTTNGVLLQELLPDLVQAGLQAVNISLDTLQPERFRAITGRDTMPDWRVLLRACVQAGLKTKTNTVLLAENREEWETIAALAQELPISVRYLGTSVLLPTIPKSLFSILSTTAWTMNLSTALPNVRREIPHIQRLSRCRLA